MPESEHGDLQRLGKVVHTERVARSWSKEAAARIAGISSVTWDRVERGLLAQDTKYAAIATAFGWKPDVIHRILTEDDPDFLGDDDEPDDESPLERQLRERLKTLAEDEIELLLALADKFANKGSADDNGNDSGRRVG